ncbi:MAG: VOC family protein [Rhizobiales bacterium]|nr:VOC family protein [Hyphomicrobiales bacterium]
MLRMKVIGFVVPDVAASVDFYKRAFGLDLHYTHPSGGYAELDSGAAVLAFLSEAFVERIDLLGGVPIALNRPGAPASSAHIALWRTEIEEDWRRAIAAGATAVKALEAKPWGQIAGYVRDQDGIIVELCTPSPRPMPAGVGTVDPRNKCGDDKK